jgi:hypothetical protein
MKRTATKRINATMERPVKTKICWVVAGLRNLRLKALSAAMPYSSKSEEAPRAMVIPFLLFTFDGISLRPP